MGRDHLPVGEHENQQQDADRKCDRQCEAQVGNTRAGEDQHDCLGSVGDARERVQRQRSQAAGNRQLMAVTVLFDAAGPRPAPRA
jgi:hypothetical protein